MNRGHDQASSGRRRTQGKTVSFIVALGQDRANDQEHRSIATHCRCSDPAGARSRAPANQGWKYRDPAVSKG